MLSSNAASDPELLDVVDPTGRHLGVADRNDVHRDGLWHQVFHCLIVRPGSDGIVVLQQRSESKAAFPGLLDLSATGHLSAGETPMDGIRELNEELGVDFDPKSLIPIGVRLLADDAGEGKNRERVHAFLASDDRPLHQYQPPREEVSALIEAKASDLLQLVDGATPKVDATSYRPGSPIEATKIGLDDLVPGGYWTVILIMADRFARGLGPLAV